MRIELEKLKDLGGRFRQIYQAGELLADDGQARLTEPAEVKGKVERRGAEVEIRGSLSARIEVPCGRCLKPVLLPVEAKFDERFTPAISWRAEPQHELAEEDLNVSVFDGEAIDLDGLVREEILLAIPGHVVCSEDCKGLCPECGADQNLTICQCRPEDNDSPLAGLASL